MDDRRGLGSALHGWVEPGLPVETDVCCQLWKRLVAAWSGSKDHQAQTRRRIYVLQWQSRYNAAGPG